MHANHRGASVVTFNETGLAPGPGAATGMNPELTPARPVAGSTAGVHGLTNVVCVSVWRVVRVARDSRVCAAIYVIIRPAEWSLRMQQYEDLHDAAHKVNVMMSPIWAATELGVNAKPFLPTSIATSAPAAIRANKVACSKEENIVRRKECWQNEGMETSGSPAVFADSEASGASHARVGGWRKRDGSPPHSRRIDKQYRICQLRLQTFRNKMSNLAWK